MKLVNVRGFVASWATQPLKVFAGPDMARSWMAWFLGFNDLGLYGYVL